MMKLWCGNDVPLEPINCNKLDNCDRYFQAQMILASTVIKFDVVGVSKIFNNASSCSTVPLYQLDNVLN